MQKMPDLALPPFSPAHPFKDMRMKNQLTIFLSYIPFESFSSGEVVNSNCPFIFSSLLHMDLIRLKFFQVLKH